MSALLEIDGLEVRLDGGARLLRGVSLAVEAGRIVGLVGALIGGFLLTVINIPALAVFNQQIPIRWIDIISAFIGAIILLLILSLLYRRT